MATNRADTSMLIKICGITRHEDAHLAAELGAGAVGFVFWPRSPRFIDPYRARRIAAELPAFVAAVGVFVNQAAEHVNGVASLVGLSAVQLHGDEDARFARLIRRPVIKAISWKERREDGREAGRAGPRAAPDLTAWPDRVTLLLDAYDPLQRGGTGRIIDWTSAACVAAARRVLLAGGLSPENVGDAVARVRPFGIDVSSGVEVRPGVKDQGRIRALFDVIRGVA
jgi:phosphoribosylanthranilate isomerase